MIGYLLYVFTSLLRFLSQSWNFYVIVLPLNWLFLIFLVSQLSFLTQVYATVEIMRRTNGIEHDKSGQRRYGIVSDIGID